MRFILSVFFIASTFFASSLSHRNPAERRVDELSHRLRRALPKENSKEANPTCYGYNGQKGRCLRLEDCFLQPLKENYIKYRAYYCIIGSEVGVCCPNAIAIPEKYNENQFLPAARRNSTGRRRSSRSVTYEMTPAYSESKVLGRPSDVYEDQQSKSKFPKKYSSDNHDKKKIPKKYSINKKKSMKEMNAVEVEGKSRHRRSIGDQDQQICGRNGRLLSQVLNNKNQNVENKAWPWAVTIINANTKEHHCGGTLVSRYHVISAAHCFIIDGGHVMKEVILARMGEYDFKHDDDSRFYDYEVERIINHPDYDDPIHEHDITVLVLKRPVRYNVYVQPACLPAPDDNYNNMTAVVVGWGKLDFGGRSSSVLREVHVPVWEHDQCVKSVTQTIFTTNVCAAAYEGGKDACQGDSGGPLVVQRDDGRWKLIGVVSWGVQCALPGKPGIYTAVNKYLDWMSEVTGA
uniref:Proclotting enzyme-3 n=1 Tax=Nilaparvata lugens TaxID=108931 RepID=A0A5Q0QP17_NILLU|nr:proclotting enzyme-3 [Nilaparvata lugens]